MVCYLTGWHNSGAASQGAMAGSLLENYAISEIIKSYWHRGHEAPVWFWRTKEGHEVDLIIEEEGKLFPVEIKMSMTPDMNMAKGIQQLKKSSNAVGKGAIVCLAESEYPLNREINIIPLSCI